MRKRIHDRMDNTKKARLTEGPIIPILLKLTGPMIVGILAMMAFNLVDTYFVGHLGTNELAAISFTFPVVMVINSLALGLGIGTAAVVSRAIGEHNFHKVQRLTTDSLLLSLGVVILFVIIGQLTVDPVFRMLGVQPGMLGLVKQYMRIWYWGMIFVVVPMVGNNAIRATGDMKTPSLIMLIAVTVNAGLDPLLIFGIGPFPRLELAGAATATVAARAVTFTVSLWVLHHRERMLTFERPQFRRIVSSIKRILIIALPAAGTNVITPVSAGIILRLISEYGPASVAGVGVAFRIQTFVLAIIMALFSVLGPFVGQNLGAGKWNRIRQSVKFSQRFAMAWGLILFLLLAGFGKPLASLFNRDPAMIDAARMFFLIVPVGYGSWSVLRLATAALNVLNRALHSTLLTLLQSIVLLIPLAVLGSRLIGIEGIFFATVLANIISGLAAFFWTRHIIHVEESKSRILVKHSEEPSLATADQRFE